MRVNVASTLEGEVVCDIGGCGSGGPGADGLASADWLTTLSEERRKVETEWLGKLDSEQFRVLRMKGTEPIHSGEYNDLMDDGIYHCAGCDKPLYTAAHKFQSGHGWPAFSDNLPDALARHEHGKTRKIEIVCAGCDGHVGHVFKSKRYPPPHHERHCVNSVSLRFVPRAECAAVLPAAAG